MHGRVLVGAGATATVVEDIAVPFPDIPVVMVVEVIGGCLPVIKVTVLEERSSAVTLWARVPSESDGEADDANVIVDVTDEWLGVGRSVVVLLVPVKTMTPSSDEEDVDEVSSSAAWTGQAVDESAKRRQPKCFSDAIVHWLMKKRSGKRCAN